MGTNRNFVKSPSKLEKLRDMSFDKDEIDPNLIKNFFVRNKKNIGFYSLFFFLSFFLLSFFIKKVWQGQFEIVLDKDKDMQEELFQNNPLLSQVSSFDKNTTLKTEVGILESPLVLMPIFEEFILEKKLSKSKKEKIRFVDWKKNNLDVSLKNNTTILSIKYRDKNKKLVIPVLKEISKKYQEYSGKTLKRKNELAKRFLQSQVNIFKLKSSESLKNLQSFAIDQNLQSISSDRLVFNEENNKTFNINPAIRNIEIEQIRVNAANKIRDIDSQIKKINSLDDINQLQYIGSTIPGLQSEGLPERLKTIEKNLFFAESKYTKDDIKVKNILKEKSLLIELLKKRALGYLKAQRLLTESIMESATRPKETLFKYKELSRKASRDEATLVDLENKLRIIEIEESKLTDPWQLITNPYLEESPVFPNKLLVSLLGLFFGFLYGTIWSFIKDKKSGLIFDENILSSYIGKTPLIKISNNNGYFNPNSFQIPISEITKDYDSLNFIYTSNIDADLKNDFSSFLKNYFIESQKQIYIFNFEESLEKNNEGNLIIVSKIDDLSYGEVNTLKERINILKLNLICIFLI